METKEIFKYTKKFKDDLDLCTKCGYCTFWCPVYQEEPVESSVARGKGIVIKSLLAGEANFTQEVSDLLSKCTLCMTCYEHCPVNVKIPRTVVAARADKVKGKGTPFPYNIIFQWLMPQRNLFGYVIKFASRFQRIFMPKTQGTIRHLSFFLSALGKGRHIPSIAPKFLRQFIPVVNKPTHNHVIKMRVGYFSGCMIDFVYPDVGKKIVGFLTKHGIEVVVPRGQGCCGAPVFMGAGDFETGRKLADSNVKAFIDVDYVISGCATCTSAIKDYKEFLADNPDREGDYRRLGEKVKDISEFLVDVLELPTAAYHSTAEAKGLKVTWHDPCHLNRYLGIKSQPRHILKSLSEIEYVEMAKADWCCGMAGTFSIPYYAISKRIADKKMDVIRSTGADAVVTSCPGCIIQLIDNMVRHNMSQKVMHLMELLE